MALVSGVDTSSLKLVQVCHEGVWSSLCDNKWTQADATVVCREVENKMAGKNQLATAFSKKITTSVLV